MAEPRNRIVMCSLPEPQPTSDTTLVPRLMRTFLVATDVHILVSSQFQSLCPNLAYFKLSSPLLWNMHANSQNKLADISRASSCSPLHCQVLRLSFTELRPSLGEILPPLSSWSTVWKWAGPT